MSALIDATPEPKQQLIVNKGGEPYQHKNYLGHAVSTWRDKLLEVVRFVRTVAKRFLRGFPLKLRHHGLGHRLVELGLIGGYAVKR